MTFPDLNPSDLVIDTYTDRPGGLITRTNNGVRITHVPTGLKVAHHDDRSIHRNKAVAYAELCKLVHEFKPLQKGVAMTDKVRLAQIVCTVGHSAVGQKRKFTGLPYQVHPFEVAEVIAAHGGDENMIIAGYLHDLLEDTLLPSYVILHLFGADVLYLVEGVTNMKWPDPKPNRENRHDLEVQRMIHQCPRIKTIKLADSYCNLKDIVIHDPKFAATYIPEKRILLDKALKEGDSTIWNKTDAIITSYLASNPSS